MEKKLEGLSENIDQESEKFENILESAYRKMDEISEQLQMFQATFQATSHAYRYPIAALSEKVGELDTRLSILEIGSGPPEPHDVAGEDDHDRVIMND